MSLLAVVQDVCAVVGVAQPTTSIFAAIGSNRTMFEMLALANEMAQRIAYDTRDWQGLQRSVTYSGNGTATDFALPADYKRMLLTSNVRMSTNPQQSMRFISDYDEMTVDQLREYITTHTGIAPTGSLGHKSLKRLAQDIKPSKAA